MQDEKHRAGYFDIPDEELSRLRAAEHAADLDGSKLRAKRRAGAGAAVGAGRAARPGTQRAAKPGTERAAKPGTGRPPGDDAETPPTGLRRVIGETRRSLLVAGVVIIVVFVGWALALILADDAPETDRGGPATTEAPGASTTVATSATPDTTPTTPATLVADVTVTLEDGRAVLSGKVVSDQARTETAGGARIAFGSAGEVIDQLEVDPTASAINPNEDPLIRSLAEPAVQGVSSLGVTISYADDGRVEVAGKVPSQAAHDRLLGAVAGVAGGLDRVSDRLAVEAPTTTVAPATTRNDPSTPTTTAPPAVVQQDLDKLLAGKVVEFDTGSAALNDEWIATVDEVARILKAGSGRVQIAGHTDNVGDPAVNMQLSIQRAESIKAALVSRGVGADRLSTIGYGQNRPIADNASDQGRQRNRRIEFVVTAR